MIPPIRAPFLAGVSIAVKAAAPTKKTNKAMKTHAIPLSFRRLFLTSGIEADAATIPACALPKRTVSVYSATPSPSRNPQFRQKRNSDGIGEWQFEQVVKFGGVANCV